MDGCSSVQCCLFCTVLYSVIFSSVYSVYLLYSEVIHGVERHSVYCIYHYFSVKKFWKVQGSLEGQLWNLQLDPETDVSLWSHQQDWGGEGNCFFMFHYGVNWRQLRSGAGPFGMELVYCSE